MLQSDSLKMGSSPISLGSDQRDSVMEFAGALKKWTNYILGWQSRFFVLRQGNLLYYKSENDVKFGCRGAINLSNALLVTHKFDECRLDVHICDFIWYLRSDTPEERQKWVNALTMYTKTPWSTQNSLYPSTLSYLALREKLQDVKSSRDILYERAEKLLKCLDFPQNLDSSKSSIMARLQNPADMYSEISNFKDTISEMLSMMCSCVDMIDARGKFLIYGEPSDASVLTCNSDSPEMVEGRHCLLGDDEFFDAVESSLERIEEEVEMRKKLESQCFVQEPVTSETEVKHPLWSRISLKTEEQIKLATTGLDESSWVLLLEEDDNMKMYSKEMEVDGLVTDPLKAVCTVKGVTGREICHYFFCPQYRQDWEPTVEQMDVVERIGQNVIVFHQVYKRVWPTAQRDTLFWSHLVRQSKPGSPDVWAVVNDSLELPQLPANDGKLVRVTFTACLHCVTETSGSPPFTRDDVTCRLTYCTVVNPGGWVPASAVRALRRKEYPKFLKKFSSYVVEKTANAEILI